MSVYSLAWRALLAVCLIFNGGDGLPRAVAVAAEAADAAASAAMKAAASAGDASVAMADCPMHPAKATAAVAKKDAAQQRFAGDDCCGGAQCHCAGAHGGLLTMSWPLAPRYAPASRPASTGSPAHDGATPDRLLRPPIA